MKINRRDFLKTTAVTAGVIATSGLTEGALVKAAHAAEPQTRVVKTNCRNCTGDCGVLAHVRDGRVIKLEGNPEFERSEGALCTKGLSGIQALYHPNRLKYPMERVGARGENKWKRISWDEAIDKIAQKLMEVRKKYGAEAVLGSTGGGGNPNFFSVGRFLDTFDSPNWFEPGAAQCYMPRTLTFMMMCGMGIGGAPSLGDSSCLEAYFYREKTMRCFVIWGTAPSYHGPSQAGRVIAEIRAYGAKTVVIDPRFTPDASKADIWLPIRPGTDVALQLAWIRYIIDKKHYDSDFVLRWTNLPFLVNTKTKMAMRESDLKSGGDKDTFVVWDAKTKSAKAMQYPYDEKLSPALEGRYTVNGIEYKTGFQLLKERAEPWTLKRAGETCWLNPDDIERAIKLYVAGPAGIGLGVATDQNPNSTQAAQGVGVLDMIMGNVEKPGTVLQRYNDKGLAGQLTAGTSTPLAHFLSEKQLNKRLGGIEHKGMLHWWTAHPSSILEAIKTGKPYPLKVWIERSGNKLGTVANTYEWAEAMKKFEFIVHMYMYPTSFSMNADILLPLNEWLESDAVVNSFNKLYARQAATHLFETVNEAWVWARIAKRCGELGHQGCKDAFDPAKTAPEAPYYDTYEEQLSACVSIVGMTWDEYKKRAPIEINPMNVWRTYYNYKEIDPKTGKPRGFDTPTKKCEVYLESFIELGRTGKPFTTYPLPPASKDYDPLPYFIEPEESPNKPIAKNFPLVMTNGRLPVWHHCTLRNIPYLREIFPVAEIWVNPVDAKKYGVSQGDWVWVESLRGKTRARALLTEGIAPGVVYMERFWNPENIETSTQGWKEMNVNILSKNTPPFNDVCGTYTLRGYQVKIYKAPEGAPEGVWIKPKQFQPWMQQPSAPTPIVTLKNSSGGK
ncbi:MAG: molybdopterin-dependent oxidoreductase [Deferribacteraceae bacterium]|jgi:anaerobic selenocysteine-containing dehydrogenase|nr:molybdopterin-dependent oxidoreductase [Deferribacteraceae bacterium]